MDGAWLHFLAHFPSSHLAKLVEDFFKSFFFVQCANLINVRMSL